MSISIAHTFSSICARVAPRVLHFSAFISTDFNTATPIDIIHMNSTCRLIFMMSEFQKETSRLCSQSRQKDSRYEENCMTLLSQSV